MTLHPYPPGARRVTVKTSERLTPTMRRITFGGPGLIGFALEPGAWGPYIKLLIPRDGEPPCRRTYSVRAFDPAAHTLTVDIVLHEPRGVASSWAMFAGPGDEVGLMGPGAVRVDTAAGHVILAGDQAALPAIAFTLERLPADVRGQAFIALDDPADRQELVKPPALELCWLDGAQALDEAVAGADWPRNGEVMVWAGAEAATARKLRTHVRHERRLGQERCAVLNYWKRGRPEGAFGYVE